MDTTTYDVIVIGAGPVGENVADRVTQGGLSAAIVERELVGGECSYWACIPTKALLRSGAALRAARDVPGAREALTGGLDVAAVLGRRDAFAASWKDEGQVSWLDQAGISLYRGQGRINSTRTVEVTGDDGATTVLTARHAVVLATGSGALVPDIAGLREAGPWTNREAAAAAAVPDRLAILGGGAVAAEMATAFAGLGASVTMLVRDGVLPRAEPFAGDLVVESLRDADIVRSIVDMHAGSVKVESRRGTVPGHTSRAGVYLTVIFMTVRYTPHGGDRRQFREPRPLAAPDCHEFPASSE